MELIKELKHEKIKGTIYKLDRKSYVLEVAAAEKTSILGIYTTQEKAEKKFLNKFKGVNYD